MSGVPQVSRAVTLTDRYGPHDLSESGQGDKPA